MTDLEEGRKGCRVRGTLAPRTRHQQLGTLVSGTKGGMA